MKLISFAFVAGLVLAAGGCKKKGAAGDDCAKAINHSLDLSRADMEKMGADAKTLQQMADLGIQHCKDDKWSADAIKCMQDAKTQADAQACYGKLTDAQQQSMNKAAMDLATAKAGSAAGSAAGSDMAGSAGSAAGSDMAGSAGSAGSAAAGSDMGSAGSAAAGSAAAGSAAGSADGSAAAGSAGSATK